MATDGNLCYHFIIENSNWEEHYRNKICVDTFNEFMYICIYVF